MAVGLLPLYSAGAMAMGGSSAVAMVIVLIVALITFLIEAMGIIRFARTGKMGEAFNFTAILDRIGKIGWGTYILALIIVGIVAGIIAVILRAIPVIGWLLLLIVIPALVIFVARYITLIYDSVPSEVPPASPPAA